MSLPTRTTRLLTLLLATIATALPQTLNPTSPSKEYIRLNGQIVAIENPAANTTPPTVSISNPASGALISSTVIVTANAIANSGSITSVQFQVDGVSFGVATASPYQATLDTTTLINNTSHTLTVIATNSANATASASITVTVNNGGSAATPLITAQTPGPLRYADFTGEVGMKIAIASSALTVTQLGRFCVSGNSQTHAVEVADATSHAILATANVSMSGCTPGAYQYAALGSPLTLAANSAYYLFSHETTGGDTWYDYTTLVTPTAAATVPGAAYDYGGGSTPIDVPGAGYCYGPVNLLYTAGGPSVSITSPLPNAPVSSTITISATAQSPAGVSSVQFLLDGANLGSAVTGAGPTFSTSWNTTATANGAHTLGALVTDALNRQASAPPVVVQVSNGAGGGGAAESIWFNGSAVGNVTLPANGVFNALATWRVEMRLHGIGSAPVAGFNQYFWIAGGYNLYLNPDGSYLGYWNGNESYYCGAYLSGVTDVEVRLQRSAQSGLTTMQVWNGQTGQPIAVIGTCGVAGAPVDLSGTMTLGGTSWNSQNYKGAMAYFRLYNTPAATAATEPPPTQPGGELLSYEFETASNLGLDSSGNTPALPLTFLGSVSQTDTTSGYFPPEANMTYPTANQNIAGTVTVTADVSAFAAMSSVQFRANGINLGSPVAGAGPAFTVAWDTTQVSNGTYTLSAVATDSLGQQTTSPDVPVTVYNAASGDTESIVFPGTAVGNVTLPANGTFNALPSWRIEARLHGIGAGPSTGFQQYIWIGTNHYLELSADGSYLGYGDNPDGYYCGVYLNGVTDISLRLQGSAVTGLTTLQVWSTQSGQPLTVVGYCGVAGAPVDLSGNMSLGGTSWDSQNYKGDAAFFRLYATPSSSSAPPPAAPPGGELLRYEFENAANLGLETSGNSPSLPLTFLGTVSQVTTP